eukprot:1235783-Amphidinium_carterae.1
MKEGLGAQSTLAALGFEVKLEVCTDSSANKGILLRQGHSSKTKHFECKLLWVQQVVARGRATIKKIPRGVNSADLLTKGCSGSDLSEHLKRMGFQEKPGATEHGLRVEMDLEEASRSSLLRLLALSLSV